MKNTKVATRYMIPIFLWSVVVTQSIQRLLVRGLSTLWAITCGTARTASAKETGFGGSTGSVIVVMGYPRFPVERRYARSSVTCALAAWISALSCSIFA